MTKQVIFKCIWIYFKFIIIKFDIPVLNLFHINNSQMNIAEPDVSSPQKTMRLFQMFADSPVKGMAQSSPTKSRTNNTF